MRATITILTMTGALALGACSTSNQSLGDRLTTDAEARTALAESAVRGEKLIRKGEKLVNKGRKQIRRGENDVSEGRDLIREGEALLRQTRQTIEDANLDLGSPSA